jgi:hypothetical protein
VTSAFWHELVPVAIATVGHETTTWSDELEDAGARMLGPAFRGVYANDKQPSGLAPGACWIYNRSMSWEPGGTHWQAAIATGNHNFPVMRWDSFARSGRLHPDSFVGADDREQRREETWCGQLCLAWLAGCQRYGNDFGRCM